MEAWRRTAEREKCASSRATRPAGGKVPRLRTHFLGDLPCAKEAEPQPKADFTLHVLKKIQLKRKHLQTGVPAETALYHPLLCFHDYQVHVSGPFSVLGDGIPTPHTQHPDALVAQTPVQLKHSHDYTALEAKRTGTKPDSNSGEPQMIKR